MAHARRTQPTSWGSAVSPRAPVLLLRSHHIPGTCEELLNAAAATTSDDVVGELVSGGVSCDVWTTFEIAANRLKLVAPDTGFSADDVFVFKNVRFVVASDATLRVLPMVEFTGGDTNQVCYKVPVARYLRNGGHFFLSIMVRLGLES